MHHLRAHGSASHPLTWCTFVHTARWHASVHESKRLVPQTVTHELGMTSFARPPILRARGEKECIPSTPTDPHAAAGPKRQVVVRPTIKRRCALGPSRPPLGGRHAHFGPRQAQLGIKPPTLLPARREQGPFRTFSGTSPKYTPSRTQRTDHRLLPSPPCPHRRPCAAGRQPLCSAGGPDQPPRCDSRGRRF